MLLAVLSVYLSAYIDAMYMFAQCLEPVLTIAAALGGKSPFTSPMNQAEQVDALSSHRRFLQTYYPPSSSSKQSQASDSSSAGGGESSTTSTTEQRPSDGYTKPAADTSAAPSASADTTNDPGAEWQPVHCYSHHLAIVNAYNQWEHTLRRHGAAAADKFCKERYLARNTLHDMKALREHFRQYLKQTGFLYRGPMHSSAATQQLIEKSTAAEVVCSAEEDDEENIPEEPFLPAEPEFREYLDPSDLDTLVRCVLCAGLYPQIVRLGKFRDRATTPSSGKQRSAAVVEVIKAVQADKSEVTLHPSCLLSG